MKVVLLNLIWFLSQAFAAFSWGNEGGVLLPSMSESHRKMFQQTIRPLLSSEARVFVPGQPEFTNATDRWDEYAEPHITVVVEVAEEKDVVTTIKEANKYHLPFLAVSGGHGSTDTLANIHNGVQIWMHKLNSVDISQDGRSATIGGGVLAREVVDALWVHNKQTVTGACDCTGVVAPMLGGGHGWLQGQKGLIADQLISANVVLADGSLVVASETEHPDLFWALKGAGHNFGLVTSFTNKIYDVTQPTWSYEEMIFTQDKLEGVYQEINNLLDHGNQPTELVVFSLFASNADVDPKNPIIVVYVLFSGSAEDEEQYGRNFRELGPVKVINGTVSYPELSTATANGNNDPPCLHGKSWMRFPICLTEYNVGAVRDVYSQYSQLVRDYPATNGSIFLFEGYSTQAVKAIPTESTAYPNRGDNLLLSPAINYKPDPKLDPVVIKFGNAARQTLFQASGEKELRAYVNYAHGSETTQELYGHSAWRQQKLKALKRKYDPHNRFGYYAPISP